jgi:ABC-2 type transport system ATP-binding protein
LLQAARAAGKTIFLSSHLLSEIELICDRVAILAHGRVARLGRTMDLLESREESQVAARGLPSNAFAGAVMNDGLLTFTVRNSAQRETLERVWSLGGEVVRVNPVKRSLEQMFLELAAEAESQERQP